MCIRVRQGQEAMGTKRVCPVRWIRKVPANARGDCTEVQVPKEYRKNDEGCGEESAKGIHAFLLKRAMTLELTEGRMRVRSCVGA